MNLRLAAPAAALAVVLARPAGALTITVEPAQPASIGVSQTFRIAKVEDAVGAVTFRWNFGDGTVTDFVPEMEAAHSYHDAGHYTVIVLGSDDVSKTSATFIETAHRPLTAVAPRHSSSIIADPENHQLWNVNPDNDSVSVIDESTMSRVREVAVGREPHALAIAPDGTIWVVNQMSDDIAVLDRSTGQVTAHVELPFASQPHGIAFGQNGMAYVSLFATGKLVEIEPGARAVTRTLELGPTPYGVSVAADGRIFVTRFLSPADHGEVWSVSPGSFRVVKTIELPLDPGPDSESSGRGVPNYVASMVISPDGSQAWVSAKKDDVVRGPQRDGQPATPDNFVRAIVCSIDMKSEAEVLELRQDVDNRSMPVEVAFSPVGDYGYVLAEANNWLGIMDAYTGLSMGGIKNIGNAPDGLVFMPSGNLFVNAFLSREVIAYDLNASLHSIDHAAPEPLARIRTVDHEPLPDQILLGKKVFFNASDSRMGHAGYMSCVSCHFGGLSDGRVWDFTNRGEGLRNTRSLLGARGIGEGRIHWSANFDEIQDFERDIRDSFMGAGFMTDDEFNARKGPNGVYDPFSKPAAGVSADLDALAAFFATFDKVSRSPFRNPDGSFTKEARLGRKIFERAGCPTCHLGPDFTDSSIVASEPLHDVGTILPTSGSRLGGPLLGIDTPTLKGVWQTAPYLHDGRAATLPEIFTKYTKDQMGMTSDLSEAELGQLVRYLQELDDVPETPVADDEATIAGGGSSCSVSSARSGSDRGLGCAVVGLLAFIMGRRRRSWFFLCAAMVSCSRENESTSGTPSSKVEDGGQPTADSASTQTTMGEAGSNLKPDIADGAGPMEGAVVAAGTQIVVEAGDSNRDHTVVSFPLAGSAGKLLLLRDGAGNRIPLQVGDDGTATFILPLLAAGQQARYTIETPTSPMAAGIVATEETNGVKLSVGAASLLRFQTKGQLPAGIAAVYLRGGYIHPLYTPGGGIVTDDYNPSHIHHHGIWSAWVNTQFNGHAVDFWNMGMGQGKVDFDALDKTWSGPVHAGLVARLSHIDLTVAQPVIALREQWIVTAFKTHDAAPPYFLLELVSTQETATNSPLQLNEYIYGGFGMRGSGQWLDAAKVTFLTSEGFDRLRGDNTKGRWCYIGGPVDTKMVGYATLGHPDNFRAPQTLRIHPDEPYLSFAPVKEGPFSIQPGTPYKSRFRVVAFDGPPDKDLLDRLWKDYATPPKVRIEPAP